MRLLLSLLFFCIIFENVTLKELNKFYLNKFLSISLRKLKIPKEELNLQRKLQQVEEDNTDITSDDAEGPNYPVSVNTTKNTGPVSTTNKLAFIQIIRFFSLRVVVTKITFGVHFYYYRRRISSIVLFRLYVSYHSRLRNLQDIIPEAESVGTTCYLKDT